LSLPFQFTFKNLVLQYQAALAAGYEILTCADFCRRKGNLPKLTLVNRVDIDFSVQKAERLKKIFSDLQIKGTFFVRLHSPEYNPFSFENYKTIKEIRDLNHELGYHSEIVDQAAAWQEEENECLQRDLEILSKMFNTKILGIASHGGNTGLNNLSFWENHKAKDFGLLYEAYDDSKAFGLFKNSLYVSDSEWTQWKCYRFGKLVEGDQRSLSEHVLDRPKLIYLLIHPETYSDGPEE